MTITLELPQEPEASFVKGAARRGLKDRPVPQSVDEIKPRRLPPPGKTAMEMVYQQLPAGETDEELQAALKAIG